MFMGLRLKKYLNCENSMRAVASMRLAFLQEEQKCALLKTRAFNFSRLVTQTPCISTHPVYTNFC